MLKNNLLLASTALLASCQLIILSLWLVNWSGLYSKAGLTFWGSFVIAELLLYLFYCCLGKAEKIFVVVRKIHFTSLVFSTILILITLAIEITVSAMP